MTQACGNHEGKRWARRGTIQTSSKREKKKKKTWAGAGREQVSFLRMVGPSLGKTLENPSPGPPGLHRLAQTLQHLAQQDVRNHRVNEKKKENNSHVGQKSNSAKKCQKKKPTTFPTVTGKKKTDRKCQRKKTINCTDPGDVTPQGLWGKPKNCTNRKHRPTVVERKNIAKTRKNHGENEEILNG